MKANEIYFAYNSNENYIKCYNLLLVEIYYSRYCQTIRIPTKYYNQN